MVHAFKNNGLYIAVDTNSGSIFGIDEVTYEILKAFPEDFSREKAVEKLSGMFDITTVDEACDEIENLKEQGLLYSSELDETGLLEQLDNNNGLKAFAFTLHMAVIWHAVLFCFQECTGNQLMSEEVAMLAWIIWLSIPVTENVEIDFSVANPL